MKEIEGLERKIGEEKILEEIQKEISIDEFINEVLNGKRDFKNIKLSGDFNKHRLYKELLAYLKDQNFEKIGNCIDFSNSKLCIKAMGLWLPHVKAINVNFEKSDLEEANFWYGVFTEASFKEANLKHAYFAQSRLARVNFQNANIYGTNFEKADLTEADLRNAKNYNRANFADVVFYKTKITKQQEKFFYAYIEESKKRFVIK